MIYLFNRKKELQKVIPRSHLASGIQIKVLNGLYELSVEVPIFYVNEKGTKYNYQKAVDKAWFAGHYDINNEFQLYKIHARKIKASESGEFIVFDSVHKFFDDAKGLGNIHDRRFRDSEAYQAAQVAFSHIGWNLADYDTTDRHDINFHRSSVTDAWKDLINTYQVEFDYKFIFDGRKISSQDVTMKKKIGEWTGERFAYGTNLMSLENEQDESEIYTAAIGRGRGEEVGDGYGARLEIDGIEWSKDGITSPVGQNWIEIPSATQAYGYYEDNQLKPRIAQEVVFEDTEDPYQLADQTYQWLLENCIPKATWKSEVARVGNLNLGDGVGIIYKDAGIIKQARVQKMEVNLLDHSKSKITLGDYKHFKNKRQQRIDSQIQRVDRDNKSYISRLKEEFTTDFDNRETAMINRIEQAKIDANAETAAAEVRMTEKIESERNQMMEDYNTKVDAAKDYAEQKAAEKADEVQGNLERATASHQGLIDELQADVVNFNDFMGEINQDIENIFGNIGNINDFIGDTTSNLSEQLKSIRDNFDTNLSNVEGNVSDLSGKINSVETALNTTKTELQNQLDESASDIESAEGKISAAETLLSEHGSKIDAQAIKIENVEGTLSSKANQTALDALQGTVSSHSTSISQNATDIQSKADSSIVNAINGTVTEQGTLISQNATDIASKADSSKVNQLEGTISNHSTEISQNATDIKRKAESSVVNTLENKVSNQGTKITENASGISSLITKTESHDDDIAEWSNLTESTAAGLEQSITRISNVEGEVNSVSNDLTETAEEVTRTISRMETVEDNLSFAETQIVANADGLSALTNRAIENEDLISDMQTEISTNASAIELRATKTELNTTNERLNVAESKLTIEADWIGSLVSEVDDTSARVSTIDQAVDSITQTVGEHDDWFGTHGSEVEQTVEGFNQKVWLSDVSEIGANIIPFSDVTVEENRDRWTAWNNMPISTFFDSLNYLNVSVPASHSSSFITVRSEEFDVIAGETYTLSFLGRTSSSWNTDDDMGYTYRLYSGESNSQIYFTSGDGQIEDLTSELSGLKRYSRSFVANHSKVRIMIGTRKLESGKYARFSFKEPKLEMGDTATPYINAISHIEHLAHKINMRVIEIDSGTVTKAELNVQADRIDSMVDQISDIEGNYGSLITQTADSIESKVWLNDVTDIQPNLIPHSNFDYPNSISQWSMTNGNATAVDSDGFYTVRHTNAESTLGMYSPYFNMVEGYEYTLSVLVKNTEHASVNYHWTSLSGAATTWIGAPTRQTHIDGIIYRNEYTFIANGTGRTRVRIGAYVIAGNNVSVRIKEPKIERGSTSTPFLNAFSAIEQEADRIRLMVQGDGESGYLTQSDITLDPDQIRIGSQQIGGQDLASVISISPRAIEMIAEEINFTGNVNIKGDIESIAMSAVNAEFANLFADQVEAGVIEASHVEGLTAEFESLYTLNANIERLVTQNVFTNAVDAISIEAVYANISSVRTRLLTAGVIDAKHLNVNYAFIDELFAYEGRISRLTSKDAFIRDIQAIEITARQLNLNTLTSRVNDIEGGLMIKRPDGAVSVNNGVLRPTFNIGFIQPHWMGVGVTTSGNYFRTNETSYVSAAGFSYEQSGRYLTITGKAEMRGDVAGTSRNTIGAIRLHGYGGTNASTYQYIDSRNDNNGNNQDFSITINMGRPDYTVKHFYVQFYSANAESSANFRINLAYQHG